MTLLGRRPDLPTVAHAEAVVRQSRRQRERTRPIIDRAADLADAFERGDMALRRR